MGEQRVSLVQDRDQMQKFVRSLLDDVQSLEYMLEKDMFEKDITRIGAEQEMCLVNTTTYKPATIAMEALDRMTDYDWVETELAKFNLETNLTPRVFTGDCLRQLDQENAGKLDKIRERLHDLRAEVILTGILPTLRRFDMVMDNLTPKKRYKALMDAINSQLIGSAYELHISGIDELSLKHDSPLLEAVNTSFQVHLQVSPDNFAKYYNIAQALAAPVMAIAANSPIVFGRRLWHESRIAMFQQALDVRTSQDHMRERSPRVNFGNDWVKKSVMEIYKEDIARFRVLLSADMEEDSVEMLQRKKIPKLRALQVHNSTVYRWNRPCYGISDNGKPHLRIENRVLPAGPTTTDEIANAAFWLGCMIGMANKVEDIRDHIAFEDVSDNFGKAAKYGIDSKFTWFNDEKCEVCGLVLDQLLPIAREGLESQKIDPDDITHYLGIIEERAKKTTNGARWQLRAYTSLVKQVPRDEALTVLTSCIVKNQWAGKPVHEWTLPKAEDLKDYRPSHLKVEEFMDTDLYTVHRDDVIELAVELMEWRKLRYIPVENTKGELVGLLSSRVLLRHYAVKKKFNDKKAVLVEDIMIQVPKTIGPNASVMEAMHSMRQNKIGCLPVLKGKELIGMITEMNFLNITGRLMDQIAREGED